MPAKLRHAEVPWCATCMLVTTLVCHTCVLVGNLHTSSAMHAIGKSTAGWSSVGLGLSRAFRAELDEVMGNVSAELLDVLEMITNLTGELDGMVSTVGNATDKAVDQGAELFLLQQGNISDSVENLTDFLEPMVMNTVTGVVSFVSDKVTDLLNMMWVKVRPLLLQVGVWLSTFGTKLTSGMETFSNTLDKVQKLLDQVMSGMNGSGNGEDAMLHESFGLFDVDGNGQVSVKDLETVAELYSINALAGSKPKELLEKYDHDGSKELDRQELLLLLNDDSVPKAMSTVLRQYAKKLTEVSGRLSRGTMRDQVALAVVGYFQLVCAKNQTKVGWVSDAMGNGSLPLDFTSSLYAQLCLEDDSPEALTTADIGRKVITRMYEMHATRTVDAFNNMANTTFWEKNGFNLLDQPACITKVGGWMSDAQKAYVALNPASLLTVDVSRAVRSKVASAQANTRRHLHEKQLAKREQHLVLFSGRASQLLLLHLTGGDSAASHSDNPLAERAVNSGQPAAPETLLFAQWLSNNATATSDHLQELSFNYASTSSSKLDNFATQIQGMIKKATSFTNMMMEYSTTAGIDKLDKIIHDFMNTTEHDILKIIKSKLGELIDKAGPLLGNALDSAIDSTSDKVASMVSGLIKKPLDSALDIPLGKITGSVLGNSSIGDQMSSQLSDLITNTLSGKTEAMISDTIEPMLEDLVTKALEKVQGVLPSGGSTAQKQASALAISAQLTEARRNPSLLQTGSIVQAGSLELVDTQISGNWQELVGKLGSLSNVLPQATTSLKNAREDIQKAVANMDSIFMSFQAKGPSIFNLIAKFWALIWVLYFLVFAPLTLYNLYYAWWASGWFGGPVPAPDNDGAVPPRNWCDRLRICCNTCGVCMTQFHDTQCCFWSMVILMQVIVLLLFIISIVFVILAGIKAFINAGCGQVYLLGDELSCMETIKLLRSFTASFFVQHELELLEGVCPTNNLMTCQLIKAKMSKSIILTVVFSFLATIISGQSIIETAIMHEQARYRRMFTKQVLDEQEADRLGLDQRP